MEINNTVQSTMSLQELFETEGEDECTTINHSERFQIKPLGDQIKDTIMTTLLPEAEKWSGVKLTGMESVT